MPDRSPQAAKRASASNSRRLERLERLATNMDALFRVPGTNIRVGADSIMGLVPGIGDAAALAPTVYIIAQSRRMGAPWPLIGRMTFNAGVDAALGSIPLLGDLFDIGWKGNLRNTRLLRRHLERCGKVPADENAQGTLTGDQRSHAA
ncbi:DUF4112 domain-containing protein [Shimia ponticola]|uniref:DUF4112 domain-containing protein n=1 Tax=Shimia ponticola TaxID=2582893 RepID=UPI0011BD69DF|nr:DUF4112 domain-containing protein [Shimia ponticola]